MSGRMIIRSAFTRQFNILRGDIQELEQEERRKKVQVSFILLRKKNEDLLSVDGKILSLKIDVGQDDLEEECRIADDYPTQFLDAEVSSSEVLISSTKLPDTESTTSGSVDIARKRKRKRKFKLPKLELRKFDGDVRQWLLFSGQFEKIYKDPDIVPEDKFQYLIQATVKCSRAREVVESFPPTGVNYCKSIEILKSRLGREDLLVEVYIRELLTLVLKNASSVSDTSSMCSLYDSLESQIRSLETLGVTSDKCAAMLYPLVESCLPEELLRAWQRGPNFVTMGDSKDRLENIMQFIELEVQWEERISLAVVGFGIKDYRNIQSTLACRKPSTATAAELLSY